jgi:2-oxoisovalerate dehydrogenase E1 component
MGTSLELPADLDPLEQALLGAIAELPPTPGSTKDPQTPVRKGSRLTRAGCLLLLDAQLTSRHLDHTARWLRAQGHGFYTIGSAGHESNAAVAAALRPTDPALLHYRSGGFYCARAMQVEGHDAVSDVLLGMLAAVDEPMAGGRHKVFGHHALTVIPQTSTIASHLPRALGVAFTIGRARKLALPTRWPDDALAVCSFGDASSNHSSAQGAINAAAYTSHQGLPLPLLFVCEDNGIGISVATPAHWIEQSLANRPPVGYRQVDGTDPVTVFDTVAALAADIRSTGRPAILHLRTVRYLGHAGSDAEAAYRSPAAIRADYERDPILATARAVVEAGVLPPDALVERYLAGRLRIRERALELASSTHQHTDPAHIMAPLSPRTPERVAAAAATPAPPEARARAFDTRPEDEGGLTLAQAINRSLADLMAANHRLLVFGEDVALKGGVYGVTRGLQKRFGAARVFDTLLDEQSILGLALGAGVSGMVPVPEIQYLAYLHNAEDQLRGEAASLSFFSQGRFRNPLVVRIAGYGYQKGFGGHFHNDNAVAVLRDIPGLIVASPSRPADAAAMLRTCVAAAAVDGSVSVFLEPIALYHTADLHETGDGAWLDPYPAPAHWPETHVPVGAGRVQRDGTDVLIVTWANGVYLAMRAAARLASAGVSCRVFDLRWLAPLPADEVLRHAADIGRVVVVDETRRSGGVGEAVVAALAEGGYRGPLRRVAAADSFVPLGDAALAVLVSEADIENAVGEVLR